MRVQYSPKCMPPTATWMRRLSVLTTCSCGTHCGHLQRVVSDVYWLPGITLQRCDQYYFKCDWSVWHINVHYLNGDMDIAWIHCVIIVRQHRITEEIQLRDDIACLRYFLLIGIFAFAGTYSSIRLDIHPFSVSILGLEVPTCHAWPVVSDRQHFPSGWWFGISGSNLNNTRSMWYFHQETHAF